MIEAMTEGGFKKRGVLFAPEDALEKDPVVFHYVRSYLEKIEILRENSRYQVGRISFSTGPKHRHGVETYGINFRMAPHTVESKHPGSLSMVVTGTRSGAYLLMLRLACTM